MKYEIVPGACRVCLRKSRTCRSIYEPYDKDDVAPSDKLRQVSGVNVAYDKDLPLLPDLICKSCEISLNMAFSLRNRARKSDQIIHIYCNRLNKDNIIVELDTGRKYKLPKELTLKVVRKSRPPTPPPALKDDSVSNNIPEDQYDEIFMDEETKSEVSFELKCAGEEDGTFLNEHQHEETVERLYSSDENNDDDNTAKSKPFTNNNDGLKENDEQQQKAPPVYNAAEIAKRLNASDKYEVISWKQPRNENSVPIFKLRLKGVQTKELPNDFICEICGNIYRQRHRLMEHMRCHNKEKNHECEICNKRFSIAEGLRRHILTHGAQKPFKCNYCTRRFYNPSARRAHEKVHSGAKPYVCRICSRAFAYSCALRKHMLIHENIKGYRCNYCNKEFRLQHHVKQHEETQIHKDAVAEHMNPSMKAIEAIEA